MNIYDDNQSEDDNKRSPASDLFTSIGQADGQTHNNNNQLQNMSRRTRFFLRRPELGEPITTLLIEKAAKWYGVTAEDILSGSHRKPLPDARCFAIWLMRMTTGGTFAACAAAVNLTDHSSAIKGARKISRRREQDGEFKLATKNLLKEINQEIGYEEPFLDHLSDQDAQSGGRAKAKKDTSLPGLPLPDTTIKAKS